MNRSEDLRLIEYAAQDGRVIATLDSDYHEIAATQSFASPSVILLRERCPPAELATELIHKACMAHGPELEKGCLLTCRSKGMRLRMLPISRR
jgi:predicted nuclease of predicted toxin-antitoxin system